jgi:transposase
LRPTAGSDTVVYATKLAIATLGRRVLALDADAKRLDDTLDTLVRRRAPHLLEVYGVGTHTAAILLVAAGDNPHRLKNEAAFAHLCGVAPIPASSGKTQKRFRLNPGGNRQANMRSGGSCSPAWPAMNAPANTSPVDSPKDAPPARSCAP